MLFAANLMGNTEETNSNRTQPTIHEERQDAIK